MNSNTNARAVAREIPVQSQLFAKKIGASYSDSYEIPLTKSTLSAEELYREIVSQTPAWINVLMRVRESTVPFVGIRRVGLLGTGTSRAAVTPPAAVGEKMDIFTIWSVNEAEIIVGEDDSHLDFRLSLLKLQEAGMDKVVLSMIVNVKNVVGRIYLALVLPFHKVIMRAFLNTAVRRHRI
jgi:hypothetical protein